ncbi:MAG: ABC transporter permease subunit [Nitrospirota bacterium]|jgi:phosphate transport system permease protein
MELLSPEGKNGRLNRGFTRSALRRRRLFDGTARVVITVGGVVIIASILAILYFISAETFPLARGARSSLRASYPLSGEGLLASAAPGGPAPEAAPVALGVEELREVAYVITRDGVVRFFSIDTGQALKEVTLEALQGRRVTAARGSPDSSFYTLATADGHVLPVWVEFDVRFGEELERTLIPHVREGDLMSVTNLPLKAATYKALPDGGSRAVAALTETGELLLVSEEVEQTLFGEGEVSRRRFDLTGDLGGSVPVSVALDTYLENLYAGTADGKLFHWSLSPGQEPVLVAVHDAGEGGAAVSSLGFLVGERSLLVGDEEGNVSVWFQVEQPDSPTGRGLVRAHRMARHGAPVRRFAASVRNRSFLSADQRGTIYLQHATTERKLLTLRGEAPIRLMAFAPKGDGAVALDNRGKLYDWDIQNKYPEVTLKTLFGKVWYEGYNKPAYVWQSTGYGDDFEPKLSLTPIVFGTFKGTLYALVFAIPMAIMGALSASQFMHPVVRSYVKPVVEIMAALPSVVLGFLGGLWLAPYIEDKVPAVFLIPPVLAVLTLVSLFLWNRLPQGVRKWFREGTEVLLLVPVYALGVYICLKLNGPVESFFLGGDFRAWLYNSLGLGFDQRNSLVVGFVMGFAIIPIIFTISEDALSNVPRHLISGSLALGATRWQTAVRVVLPTASAGIFSAMMIGLGRGVGETMIVLMATGNTPIMDWNIFNGFRALSANIAVEIPEAPHGATLYRVLFLAALLLFALTFIVNTVAEVVRTRLREKYGKL